jgi:hypothetical protein
MLRGGPRYTVRGAGRLAPGTLFLALDAAGGARAFPALAPQRRPPVATPPRGAAGSPA